jgi:hypothetical protein
MNAQQDAITNRCKKLLELLPVSTDWQQTTWCPDCEYYDCGACGNPERSGNHSSCPYDGAPVPLREVSDEPNDGQFRKTQDAHLGQRRSRELEKAIRLGIVNRTRGRIQSLEVELVGRGFAIRGSVPSYHVKQLALQGILDVIRSSGDSDVELILQVEVSPARSQRSDLFAIIR